LQKEAKLQLKQFLTIRILLDEQHQQPEEAGAEAEELQQHPQEVDHLQEEVHQQHQQPQHLRCLQAELRQQHPAVVQHQITIKKVRTQAVAHKNLKNAVAAMEFKDHQENLLKQQYSTTLAAEVSAEQ
jgi:hypothetical protein